MLATVNVNLMGIKNNATAQLVAQSIRKILDPDNNAAIENYFSRQEARKLSELNLKEAKGKAPDEDKLLVFSAIFPDNESTEKTMEFIETAYSFHRILPGILLYNAEPNEEPYITGSISIESLNNVSDARFDANKRGCGMENIETRELPVLDLSNFEFHFLELAHHFPESPRDRAFAGWVTDTRNGALGIFTFRSNWLVDSKDTKALATAMFRDLASDCGKGSFREWAERRFGHVPKEDADEYPFMREIYSRKTLNYRNALSLFGGDEEKFRQFVGLPPEGQDDREVPSQVPCGMGC